MEKLSDKQAIFYHSIETFIKENKYLPTIGEIKNNLNCKSYNSIHEYLKVLIKKNYLTYDIKTKRIGIKNNSYISDNLLIIPYININSFIKIDNTLLRNNNYLAYLIKNNNLNSFSIVYKDTIIVSKDLSRINNKIVLVDIDNSYKVFKYNKRNGFHHLFNDKETIVLENTNNIIGKVVLLIRNTTF